jgi:5-methyltetrahydropteroyltriglutamate--homocysteine methyltransferase
MVTTADRILTTHVGSLPRPPDLIALYRDVAPPDKLEPRLKRAVAEVVQQQIGAGIDVVDDGEFGKPMTDEVDYGAWARYVFGRLGGFELRDMGGERDLLGVILGQSKDFHDFREFYRSGEADVGSAAHPTKMPINVGPITYTGHAALQRDIANLKAAIAGRKVADAFIPAVVTGVSVMPGEYYKSAEAQAVAVAEAIREEYRAIVDAGFMVQLDDPILVNQYEMYYSMNADLAGFRKWAEAHIELVNHGLTGIPEDRVRYHVCWGSWKGPHSTDLPLNSVLDLILKVRAAQYSVEAANPQHEHEWQDWEGVKLPAGKIVVPGVVTHKTNILEHPQVVADRILRYAGAVGRENVIASTDCGMGGRIHPSLAWAKLRALSEGAARASERLWGRRAAAG